jgi:uracil-DNA glycosylase
VNQGFFSQSELLKPRPRLSFSPKCGACKLNKGCKSPKMPYSGEGRKKILIVGEAPGSVEDLKGIQFVGKAGQRLEQELKSQGINLRKDCWVTNACRCRPKDNKTPNSIQISACRSLLFKEIEKLQPNLILLFGSSAAESVLGYLWKESGEFTLSKWSDWIIPCREPNSWISVNYHPSYLEREQNPLLNLLFRRNLKKALLKKTDKPWKDIPNYENEIDLIYKSSEVIKLLKDIKGDKVAFDYETNCIKPETPGAEIVCCSICIDGKKTFSFPWNNSIIEPFIDFLKSPVKKISGNLKFEERWSRYLLKTKVNNWYWDTVLAGHILNNATGVTSVKFQSFVRLGLPPYNEHIEPYLELTKKGKLNRIREININDLLLYCGIDSLVEYKLMELQRKEMEIWDKKLK